MNNPSASRAAAVFAGIVLACAAGGALADPAQVVEQSIDYGTPALPFTRGFSLSLAPMSGPYTSSDEFLSDYGFHIGASGAVSSAVVTFDLASALQLSDVTLSLLHGDAWGGAVPAALTPAEIADRDARVILVGSGDATTQTFADMTLPAGDYVVEVSGRVTGTSGGSFAGVLNVAAVPEPDGFALGMAGLGLLAFMTRRARR